MKKSLGGDRLGSGKKMDVDLHNYGRSTHDLGYIFRSTMSAGTLVPFLSEIALPGDTFDINLECDVKTHPTVGPMFGSSKVQLDLFVAPIRLYQAMLHNNKLGIGMNMAAVKLPQVTLTPDLIRPVAGGGATVPSDLNNAQVNPSSIFAYLGIRGAGVRNSTPETRIGRDFNAIPWLAYWEIYKNYYANKQEEIGVVIHTGFEAVTENVTTVDIDGESISEAPAETGNPTLGPASVIAVAYTGGTLIQKDVYINLTDGTTSTSVALNTIGYIASDDGTTATFTTYGQYAGLRVVNWRYRNSTDTGTSIDLVEFDLENIDTCRDNILMHVHSSPFYTNTSANFEPYNLAIEGQDTEGEFKAILQSQEGLAVKTYQSDIFNNWLSTEWIDGTNGISEITSVDTSGGSFTIDTLNLSKKVYDMLNRIAVSGGSYDDWMDAVYTHERYKRAESPMYMGGLIKELIFQEVVSNSEAGGDGTGGQPLGTLAGKGVMSKKHKGGGATIRIDEPSYIIGIVSITPRIDYSQGNKWDMHLKTMDDLHKPALDEIGFQELITEQMAWWDTYQDATGEWITQSAGKQPAWLNYMTNHNRVFGNFAIEDNEMFMVNNRRYQGEAAGTNTRWQIEDLTTYIDPRKFNYIFAETALDSQNYWTQIAVDITCRRKISARLMPNL